jgi:hypothetical protein
MAVRKNTLTEPTVLISNHGYYKNVLVTNTGSQNLVGYQVKLNGSAINVSSRYDSLKFTAPPSGSSGVQSIIELVNAFLNWFLNPRLNLGGVLTWQTS